MAYDLITLADEAAYRQYFEQTYCNPLAPILTHDNIWVRFFPEMFDHAFFESASRKNADKSLFSTVRAERIGWIKETLEDPTSILKVGWDKKAKSYDYSKRVAIVKGDYVVIIKMIENDRARFITAYVADNSIGKILGSPAWP